MTKKIPILDSDYKVVYLTIEKGKEKWIEYNRYITLDEATKKAEELNKKGFKAKAVQNIIRQMEIEVTEPTSKDGPY